MRPTPAVKHARRLTNLPNRPNWSQDPLAQEILLAPSVSPNRLRGKHTAADSWLDAAMAAVAAAWTNLSPTRSVRTVAVVVRIPCQSSHLPPPTRMWRSIPIELVVRRKITFVLVPSAQTEFSARNRRQGPTERLRREGQDWTFTPPSPTSPGCGVCRRCSRARPRCSS